MSGQRLRPCMRTCVEERPPAMRALSKCLHRRHNTPLLRPRGREVHERLQGIRRIPRDEMPPSSVSSRPSSRGIFGGSRQQTQPAKPQPIISNSAVRSDKVVLVTGTAPRSSSSSAPGAVATVGGAAPKPTVSEGQPSGSCCTQ